MTRLHMFSIPFDLTTLTAPDGSITAKLSSRHIFYPITKYPQEDGPNVYHTALNDHDGSLQQTIHGGLYGWDRRNWTIVEKTSTSVTYTHLDPADEGFPGNVTVFARHSVANHSLLHSDVWAYATERTPIMVTQHIYWNLDAYQNDSTDVLNHYLRIDGDKVIEIDGDSIPTGDFINVEHDPMFDFRDGRLIGENWNATKDLCGTGCYGFDHSWVYTGANTSAFLGKNELKTSLWSNLSGIRLDISTDQPNVHVFSAYWLGLLMQPRKVVHGGPLLNYT
ncbi:galactose mutarotase-like domain-containing protein [Mucidula mucida]|nr:galactose mutarotase-like domain-containing protein [Mucidula mucida]